MVSNEPSCLCLKGGEVVVQGRNETLFIHDKQWIIKDGAGLVLMDEKAFNSDYGKLKQWPKMLIVIKI